MKKQKVAVMGATGVVGGEMLNTLYERNFPVSEVIALASDRSAGQDVSFGETTLRVKSLKDFDFTGVDIALASAGGDVALEYAPRAAKAGCVVIDNSSAWRMDPDVPLIVPEVNAGAIKDYKKKNIIANPNCSTIQMVVALKPLHDIVPIKRVVVTTFQSVSGAGKDAMDELFNQTKGFYMNQDAKNEEFPKQIAFNVIPQIDRFMDDRMTKEEWKMMAETKKIIDPKIKVCANCVRVPVFVGHSMMVNVEFEGELSMNDAKKAWRTAKGLTYIDLESDLEYVTPVEIHGEDNVYVSRLREDQSIDNGLNFWCVADNLRKGAALNAVQIAELLGKA
ncbi:MAG: aspartate-semialdehyde dehydrogenase [Alphaproteobacteria bacterium]|nr:aspartate-semialdehyde dehydrogenase [Alphaproteobacteria bacterium]